MQDKAPPKSDRQAQFSWEDPFLLESQLTEEERAYYEQAFGGRSTRRAASPLRLVRSDAPRFLGLAAEHDIPGYLNAGNAFAEALRETGHPDAEFYFMLGRNHFSILDMK